MSENTAIEWTDKTWSPWEGCTKISAGCAHCYAAARNHRFGDNWGPGKPRRLTVDWKKPVRWNKAATSHWPAVQFRHPRVFPSLCDWLDDEVPIEWLARLLALIHNTPNLDWLLLTKRPELFRERIENVVNWMEAEDSEAEESGDGGASNAGFAMHAWANGHALENVWIGTSVEDQSNADRRIPELLKIPAKLRFLSVEPMLGPIDLKLMRRSFGFPKHITKEGHAVGMPQGIHWVIVGGESGPGARPCNVAWVRDIVRQCAEAGVACFVKQLGANVVQSWDDPSINPSTFAVKLKHPKGGDPAEWPEDLRVRQMPEVKP